MSIVQDAPKTQQVLKTFKLLMTCWKKTDVWLSNIVETTDIHGTTVYRIVSDDMGMKKVSACWVPRMLMDEHKQNRADVCTGLLCRLQAQPQFFVDRIVMQCYCRIGRGSITLIRRQNNKVWSGNTPVLPFLRNSRSPYLLGKSMATVFGTLKVW